MKQQDKESGTTTHNTQVNMNLDRASDDDIRRVLEIAARVSENGSGVVQSGVVQEES